MYVFGKRVQSFVEIRQFLTFMDCLQLTVHPTKHTSYFFYQRAFDLLAFFLSSSFKDFVILKSLYYMD